jgi:beta-lactamase class A
VRRSTAARTSLLVLAAAALIAVPALSARDEASRYPSGVRHERSRPATESPAQVLKTGVVVGHVHGHGSDMAGWSPYGGTLEVALEAIRLARSADGMQGRYNAGRRLEDALYARGEGCSVRLSLARGLVRWAEGYDQALQALESAGRRQALAAASRVQRPCAASRLAVHRPRLPRLPPLRRAAPPRTTDLVVDRKLEALGRSFPGFAAIWEHDAVRGTSAGWNTDARFPAASTVKLGLLLAVLQRLRHPERSPLDYELRAMTAWSSNLAANLLVDRFGAAAAQSALRRAGAYRSTFPQGYRVGTALSDVQAQPPLVSGRVTTAADLGRILYVLHGCALGNVPALRATGLDRARCGYALQLLLASEPRGNNVGLVRPFVPEGTPVAQKNGWLHDARHTAAIVYGRRGPRIVVVLTYTPNLRLSIARELGRKVLAALR